MTITFHVEAFTLVEAVALDSDGAPSLNVHLRGAGLLFDAAGIDPTPMGEIAADDLLARFDAYQAAHGMTLDDLVYVAQRLRALHEIAAVAHRLGRRVVWS